MAHGTRINGAAYGVTGGKCLVGGTEYGIKKGRTLIGGTGYDITFNTPLSSYAEGSIVLINESGLPVEFYVAKHDYESALNGAGRTLVVRKDVYDLRIWSNSNRGWARSDIFEWLNGTYKSLLDPNIQSLVGTTAYYYTPSKSDFSVATRSDAVFLMSVTELGLSHTSINVEGSTIPISETLKIAYKDNSPTDQWTRSMNRYGNVGYANSSGSYGASDIGLKSGSRPIFTLPSSVIVGDGGLIL